MAIADNEIPIIPPNLPNDVRHWTVEHVEKFLVANKAELYLTDNDIQTIKEQRVAGKNVLRWNAKKYEEFGILSGPADNIEDLVDKLKVAKGKVSQLKPGESCVTSSRI